MDGLEPARWLQRAVSPGSTVRIGQQVRIVDRRGRRGRRVSAGRAHLTPAEQCLSRNHDALAGELRPADRHPGSPRAGLGLGPEVGEPGVFRPKRPSAAGSFGLVSPGYASHPNQWACSIKWNHPRCPNYSAERVSCPNGRVSRQHVPNIGITGTVGKSPAIRMLGHRRTCHTTPTGPMIHLSPADQMVCPARRPVGGPRARSAELLRGRNSRARRSPYRR